VDGKAEQDLYGRIHAPLRPLNNKVIVASDEEVARNPRARSAKLRIAVKLEE
jgi:16S rRNA (cytosine1402-N4)-methyltransferase